MDILIYSRRILRNSYIYSYFYKPKKEKRIVFENYIETIQNEVESASDMVGRKLIHYPLGEIIPETEKLRNRTEEFLLTVYNGIFPDLD